MKIGLNTHHAITINNDAQRPHRASNSPPKIEGDTVHTSTHALQLSRNLTLLKEQLSPRAEILQQFAQNIDAPVKLNASSMDRILKQL